MIKDTPVFRETDNFWKSLKSRKDKNVEPHDDSDASKEDIEPLIRLSGYESHASSKYQSAKKHKKIAKQR